MSDDNQAAGAAKDKVSKAVDPIHNNAILEEGIKREQKFHRLYTDYTVTPALKKSNLQVTEGRNYSLDG